jgi:anthranilate phosphoribosyltransferase
MDVREAIARLVEGVSLAEAEMEAVVTELMHGEATPAQIAGLLIALRMKGETVDELTGAARAMRANALRVHPHARVIVDTCGTGGDAAGTFNVSTAAAFIAAGAGITVAKHGNRAMSGRVGGADVLEALGVNITLPADRVADCIDEVGIGFLFAQTFHPAMKYAAAPRRELGVRTLFNLIGPLSNPAGAQRQVVGVFSSKWTDPLARSLHRLGSEHALVVAGADGLDEISLTDATRVSELRDGEIRAYEITPEEFGLRRCRVDDLAGGDREQAARHVRDVLSGAADSCRNDFALLNAAAAIYVGGGAPSITDGLEKARESIRTGSAARKLAALVEFSNR